MNISKKLIYLCATVLTAVLSVGCSQSDNGNDPDDPGFEEGIPTEVLITFSTRSGNAQTRADGTAKDPVASVELIHDWWIVFINKKNGEVVKIIKNTDTDIYDRTTSTSVSLTGGGYEAETFRTIIPSGTYRIYAFANILPKTKEQFKELLDSKGKLVDKYIKDFVDTDFIDDMQWPSTEKIPMTKVMEKEIKNTVEEAFNIEVIRAVAKVEFAFSNPSVDKITLQTLVFGPITKDYKISIVPNDTAVGNGPNNDKLLGLEMANLTFSAMKETLQPKVGNHPLKFYCKESLPKEKGGPFTIKLTVDKNDVRQDPITFYTKDITYINRNDWIYIPISFTKWSIYWRMHYYPPIGGYPPLFEQSNDGEKVEILATTAGEFEIFPDIFENGNEYALNATEWGNVKIDPAKIKQTDLWGNNLPAGKSLFVVPPAKQTAKGTVANKYNIYYISGEFSNVEGIAIIEVDFMLSAGPYANQKKTCTFTITRKNGYPTTPTSPDP